MRELVLILPDLFVQDDALAAEAACETSLRFAPAQAVGGWRRLLARGLGREELGLLEPACVVAAATGAELDAWLATPLHWVAGLTTVHLPQYGRLRLDPDEARLLTEAFARQFGADGLALKVCGSDFLLEGLGALAAQTADPATLFGQSLREQLPGGADGEVLRSLMSEIEMWLHGLPLNAQRSARGLPVMSSLWLWGGGVAPRVAPQAEPAPRRWSFVCSDDSWVAACAHLAQIEAIPLPLSYLEISSAAISSEVDIAIAVTPTLPLGLAAIDERYVAPAAAALASGTLLKLTLVTTDRACSVQSVDRWRWWRPRRKWWATLMEQA